jgi:hypothetical protein
MVESCQAAHECTFGFKHDEVVFQLLKVFLRRTSTPPRQVVRTLATLKTNAASCSGGVSAVTRLQSARVANLCVIQVIGY